MLLKYSFNLSDEDFRLFSDGLPYGWRSLIANERFKIVIIIIQWNLPINGSMCFRTFQRFASTCIVIKLVW